MTASQPVLLEAVGVPDGHTIASYRSRGGYAPLEQVLAGKQPADVIEMVKSSGLRGRGGNTGPRVGRQALCAANQAPADRPGGQVPGPLAASQLKLCTS